MTKFIYFIILFCFYSNTIQADTVNSQQTSDSFLYSNTTQAANITFQQMSKSFINEASHYLSTGETYIDTAINDVSNLINSLANLTCETTALLNMYKGDMEHTCTPTPLVSLIVSQILAPNALPVLLRLSMNNSKLLGYDNCAVYKRASYYSPSVTFGMCLNTKLIPNRILPLAEAIGTSITAAFTGGDPAAAFKNINLNALPPDKVYQKYTLNISGTNSEGPTVTLWDIPVGIELTYMPLKLKRYDDRVCVSTTLFDGWTPTEPIGCKYTIDPYEISKYAGFMGESGDKIAQGKQNKVNGYYKLDINNTPGHK